MRIGLIVALIVMLSCDVAMARKITADPNAAGAARQSASITRDPRLAQNVTYKVRLKDMTTILTNLTEKTGIKMYVGRSPDDWRVREDIATICANELPLYELMNSLARVMKFAWIRSGEGPNWTYRLVESHSREREIRQAEEQRARVNRELRRKALEQFMSVQSLPEKGISRLREENPELYVSFSSGAFKHAARFLRAAPDVAQAWVDCKRMDIPVRALSSEAREALRDLTRADRERKSSTEGELDAAARTAILEDAQHSVSSGMVRVYEGTPEDPYWGIDVPGGGNLGLNPPHNAQDRLRGRVVLRAFEEKRPAREIARSMSSEFDKLSVPNFSEMLLRYTDEEILKHEDEPFLHETLKAKLQSKRISALMFELAEATGFSIVTDDFRGTNYFCSLDETHEVGEALAKITSTRRRMNWSRGGNVIEIWGRDWYHKREGRVSKVWLEGIRERFRTNGTLDIEDLCALANLTDEQLRQSIYRNRALRRIAGILELRRPYLKLYGSLTSEQKAMLFTQAGLPFSALTEEQKHTALSITAGIELPFSDEVDLSSVGARVNATKSRDGQAMVYTLQAFSDLGPMPGQYKFRTPVYTPPRQPGKGDLASMD